MLQTIRDKVSGWFAAVFLGAIAVVFIFWGIDFQAGALTYAARVNGERIPSETVLRAWQDRQSQLMQMLGGEIPDELRRSQQEALLDEFVRVRLLTQRTEDLGYRVTDAQVAETIRGIAELQVDGSFSRDRYAAALRQQGRTEPQFEAELRTNLALSQLQNGITASAFVTPRELERRRALQGEQREIEYVVIPAQAFASTVQVTDADIQAWYDERKDQYLTPETLDIEYLDLRLADVEQEVVVNDEELRAYYEQVKDRFETQERRHARHVLITVGDGVDDAAAQARAQEVYTKARAGEDFGKLAQEYSQDTGSAQQGGDLGWATRGMFVAPVEEAIFAMNPGELRGPVKSEFGYHVIRLDELDAGTTRNFEEVRAEIEPEFRRERAQALFYERGERLANEAFASLTQLEPVAQALNMPLQQVTGFTRQGGGDLGMSPEVIEAAFNPDVADRGQNSPLVSIGDDRAVVLRVTEHKVPEQLPLSAVRAQIETQLRTNAMDEAAARKGNEALARLEGGAAWTEIVQGLSRELAVKPADRRFTARADSDVPAPILQTSFAIPRSEISSTSPGYRTAALENGDAALVAVSAVRSGNAEPEPAPERATRGQRTAQQIGGQEFSAYVAQVEQEADVVKNTALFQ